MWGLFKRKQLNICNKETLINTLTQIHSLLIKNEFLPQAEAIERSLIKLKSNDTAEFIRTLKTVDIWGGSGAVWEVGGFKTLAEEKKFKNYFINLIKELQETGIRIKTGGRIVKLFSKEIQFKSI